MENPTNNNPNPTPAPGSDYQTIDAYLLEVSVAIQNSDHPDIAPVLEQFGYTPTIIAIGEALLSNAVDKHQSQIRDYGDKFRATDQLHDQLEIARDLYVTHLNVARVAFKDDRGILTKLHALGRRKRDQMGWLGQAKTLYKNLLESAELKTGMARFGQTEAKMEAAFAEISKVENALAKKQKESGEAQTGTRTRDQALEDLANWNDDFTEIARIAFNKTPHLLEILGLKQVA